MTKRERPILFSTEMVKALLEGRKTQTRRGLKENLHSKYWKVERITESPFEFRFEDRVGGEFTTQCPYGNPGDILWVRETCWISVHDWNLSEVIFKTDNPGSHPPGGWRPSIHMPKVASRIWLEITDIRVERLQSITNKDAKSEGAPDALSQSDFGLLGRLGDWKIPRPFLHHQFGFLAIWCRINGWQSWLANPFVWVISFKVLSTTGKPDLKT
jgi:hypothetical protein